MPADIGLTTRDAARRYRVGEDKIRAWIKAGELEAINTATATCGKPRYVITTDALERFEQRRGGDADAESKAATTDNSD